MAEDTVCLLDHLGWTGRRELNVVGISMGGMIAQGILVRQTCSWRYLTRYKELATRIPERIVSLVLGVTTPGGPIWNNFPPVRFSSFFYWQFLYMPFYTSVEGISFSGKTHVYFRAREEGPHCYGHDIPHCLVG